MGLLFLSEKYVWPQTFISFPCENSAQKVLHQVKQNYCSELVGTNIQTFTSQENISLARHPNCFRMDRLKLYREKTFLNRALGFKKIQWCVVLQSYITYYNQLILALRQTLNLLFIPLLRRGDSLRDVLSECDSHSGMAAYVVSWLTTACAPWGISHVTVQNRAASQE